MEAFVQAVRDAVVQENWHCALSQALTLPDICGSVRQPKTSSGARYKNWWLEFAQPHFTIRTGPSSVETIFLGAGDAYALRCAFLHSGETDVADQRASEVLSSFYFVAPKKNWVVHLNKRGGRLQLQVDIFCEAICKAVDDWLATVAADVAIQNRMRSLMTVNRIDVEGIHL